jgi:mono/diheme cytochrome c family protein
LAVNGLLAHHSDTVTFDTVPVRPLAYTSSREPILVMTKSIRVVLSAVLVLGIAAVVFAARQSNPSNPSPQPARATEKLKPPYHDIYLTAPAGSLSGPELYKELCAGCHGGDGRGVGPTARYCVVPPTDLTSLTKRNRGTFPEQKVTQILRYGTEKPVQTQSTTYMPVWKPLLASIHGESPELTEQRITSITDYLKTLQGKPATK